MLYFITAIDSGFPSFLKMKQFSFQVTSLKSKRHKIPNCIKQPVATRLELSVLHMGYLTNILYTQFKADLKLRLNLNLCTARCFIS